MAMTVLSVIWSEFLGRPVWCQGLDSMILVGSFQLGILYSILFCSTLLYSTLLYSTLLYSSLYTPESLLQTEQIHDWEGTIGYFTSVFHCCFESEQCEHKQQHQDVSCVRSVDIIEDYLLCLKLLEGAEIPTLFLLSVVLRH